MINGCYYREEARRCRVRAAREPDSISRARWLQLASEYELLADDLEASPPSAPLDCSVQLQERQQHRARETPGTHPWARKAPAND